jgi:hypothetical protein
MGLTVIQWALIRKKDRYDHSLSELDGIEKVLEAISNPLSTDFDFIRRRVKKLFSSDIYKDEGLLQHYQRLRNQFAHCAAILNHESGHFTLEGHDKTYSHDDFPQIRRDLLKIIDAIYADLSAVSQEG